MSPHLLGQSLSQDLQNFNRSEAVVLQYVDDILLCAETEEACSRASEDFLNFLADWLQGIKRKGSALSTIG